MIKKYGKVILVLVLVYVLLIAAACSIKTSYEGSERIAEPSEIAQLIHDGSDIIILDVRSKEKYSKGHLKGAIHLDVAELVVSEPVPSVMASKEKIAEVLGSKGITSESSVYLYDSNAGVNSSRVWWTMKNLGHQKVEIINNGSKGLEIAGLPMSLEVPEITKVKYVVDEVINSKIATITDVVAVVNGESEAKIIDVRSLAEFDEGAIPDAVNYPHTSNLYSDGTFKSRQDIALNYKDIGIEPNDEVILYCKSSFRATQTLILLEEAGYENVKVYDGAWLEWMNSENPSTIFTEPVKLTEQDAS